MMDKPKIEQAIKKLIEALGENPNKEHLKDTPRRVADMFANELIKGDGHEPKITIFPNKEKYDEIILHRNISFYSLCAHHLIPFFGQVSVGYIPKERIIGLSKLARIVDFYSARLQNQEDMTIQIADFIESRLVPKGVLVVVEARHLCMEMRGIKKIGSNLITSSVRGRFRKDPRTRAEAFSLIEKNNSS